MVINSWGQDFQEGGKRPMLEGCDRANVLAHQLARLFEIEAEHQPVHDHVSLILRELSEGIGDLLETKPLIDGVQRILDVGRCGVAGLNLRMAVLGPEPIHDLGVCDLEEPSNEFALGPAAETSDGLQCGDINVLHEVLSRGLLANAGEQVAEDSSVGGFVELGKGLPILPASPLEPFDIPRGWVFMGQWGRHLESRHSLPWGYGLNGTVTTVQRGRDPDAAGPTRPGQAVSGEGPATTK